MSIFKQGLKTNTSVALGERTVPLTVRRSKRARRVTLRVNTDATLTATLPVFTPEHTLQNFIVQKSEWLLEKIHFYESYDDTSLAKLTKRDYAKHKEEARKLITERVEHFANEHHYVYGRISIRNQKTCWGSCSGKNNLNFNYKLIFLTPELCDYVIVHELCHLKEMNHSKKFWKLVEDILPNYKTARTALQKIL